MSNKFSKEIAMHVRAVHTGGNWTTSSLKEHLTNLNWELAVRSVQALNSIATLVFHMNYFVLVAIKALAENELVGNDSESFDHPPITCQADWDAFMQQVLEDGEALAALVEQLTDEQLLTPFFDPKYGNYYRNLQGIVEHIHYHLGQVVLMKKLVMSAG